MTTQPPTLADLEALLESRGIHLNDVRSIEICPERHGNRSAPLMLRVTRYLTNADGRRFAVLVPGGAPEVATEPILFPLESLPRVRDQAGVQVTINGPLSRDRATEAVEEFMRDAVQEMRRGV